MKNKEARLDCIEVLRGFAVLFVVIHHVHGNLIVTSTKTINTFYNYFGGWVGVDLFFAISGFVIARSILPKLESASSTGEFWHNAFNFWIKRAWRLLPSAWLWLFIILFLSYAYNKSEVFGSVSTNLHATVAGMLNFANVRFVHAFGNYFYGASFVQWSLSLEEQFYFLLPLVFFVSRRWFPVVVVVLALQQLLTAKGLWGMAFRLDAILLGVLLAMWNGSPSYKKLDPVNLNRGFIRVMVIAIFSAMLLVASEGIDFKSYRVSVVALLSIILVWLASYNNNYIMPQGILLNLLKGIGRLSYTIYLIHIPVFYLIRETAFRFDVTLSNSLLLLLASALIYLIAEFNYKYIESPLRKKGTDIVERRNNRLREDDLKGITN